MRNPFVRLWQQHLLLAVLVAPLLALALASGGDEISSSAAAVFVIFAIGYSFAGVAANPRSVFDMLQRYGLTALTVRIVFICAAFFALGLALAYPSGDAFYAAAITAIVCAVIADFCAAMAALFSGQNTESANAQNR